MEFQCLCCLLLSALFGICWSNTTPGTNTCPSGWLSSNGICYYIGSDNATWFEAQQNCLMKQATLLRIKSAAEMSFISSRLQTYKTTGFWSGLDDLNEDKSQGTGTWRWESSEYPDLSLIKWNKEPDNVDNQDCCAINTQAKFSDELCGRRLGFICEINPPGGLSNAGCPFGWIQGDTTCLYISSPNDFTQRLSWTAAKINCTSWIPYGNSTTKAFLYSMNGPQDSSFIQSQMPFLEHQTLEWWTGLNDITSEGNYVWANGDPYSPDLVQWASEPDNVGNLENCGFLLQDGTFSDRNCRESHGYICRASPPATSQGKWGCGSWIRGGRKCYSFFNTPKTWQNARMDCLSYKGQLAKIQSKDEMMYVSLISRTRNTAADRWWIGANDIGHNLKWVWADGSPADNSILIWNKSPFQPDVYQCADLTRDHAVFTSPCSLKRASICEKVVPSGCQPGWVNRPNTNNCYLTVTTKLPWQEARDNCMTYTDNKGKAYLLNLADQPESQWINTMLGAQKNKTIYEFYFGMNDRNTIGTWVYDQPIAAIANMAAINWSQEPNNYNGDEQCVQIYMDGTLNDEMCNRKIGYICETQARRIKSGSSIFPNQPSQTGTGSRDKFSILSLLLAMICAYKMSS